MFAVQQFLLTILRIDIDNTLIGGQSNGTGNAIWRLLDSKN